MDIKIQLSCVTWKKRLSEYYEQLYGTEFDNLDELDKLLGKIQNVKTYHETVTE